MRSWLVKVYDEQGLLRRQRLTPDSFTANKYAKMASWHGFTMLRFDHNMVWFKNGQEIFKRRLDCE